MRMARTEVPASAEPVVDLLPGAAALDQPGPAEDSEMVADSRLAQTQSVCEKGDALFACHELFEQPQAGGIGQNPQGPGGGCRGRLIGLAGQRFDDSRLVARMAGISYQGTKAMRRSIPESARAASVRRNAGSRGVCGGPGRKVVRLLARSGRRTSCRPWFAGRS